MARADQPASARMVTTAREAKGWSQAQLAAAAGVTQGFVSKVENGLAELLGERLTAFAAALGCPVSLLTRREQRYEFGASGMFHRRRYSKITVAAAKQIEAISHLIRITVDALLEGVELDSGVALERVDIGAFGGDAADIARELRARCGFPAGPIENLHAMLDDCGVVVVAREFDATAQDAFSTWPRGRAPLIVVRPGLSADRERFTLAHELGHLLMHVRPNPQQERQADLFAAELLLPAEDIRPQLVGLTTRDLHRLMELKAQWKVSIGALIQRAKTLELISDRQFREFRIKLSKLGWNTVEPIDLEPEYSGLLTTVMDAHRGKAGAGDDELARIAYMTPDAFRHHYLGGTSALAGRQETGQT